jgi:hypothetical protein
MPTIALPDWTIREIERVQTESRVEQTWLNRMAGTVVAVMVRLAPSWKKGEPNCLRADRSI